MCRKLNIESRSWRVVFIYIVFVGQMLVNDIPDREIRGPEGHTASLRPPTACRHRHRRRTD